MMNSTTSTMFGGNGNQITVLERQQARIQQQQIQSQQQSYFNEAHFNLLTLPVPLSLPSTAEQLHGLITNESLLKAVVDPGMENGWSEFGKYPIIKPGFGVETTGFGSVSNESVKNSAEMVDYSISRTTSCPPAVAESRAEMGVVRQGLNMKKRKADKAQSPKASVAEEAREKKRSKGSSDDESKVTEQSNINNNNSSSNTTTITTTNNNNNNSKENSGDSSKENSKVFGPQKLDYIHVRARRGQATDSHSLAERVRREKISERMKYLQDLVPGCNKITGKAGMLDEIINYVQSLQRQVEFLSMKLATVNPRQDFNIDNFFPKEMYPACSGGFSSIGMSSEMENCSAYLPYNPVQQVVSCCGMDMVINPPDALLRRTTSAPVSAPDALLDTSCFTQTNPTSLPWETDLQSLYNLEFNQARSTVFPPQSFTETMEANHLKMEL